MPTGLGGEKLWLCPTLEGENLDLSGNGNHGTYQGDMGTVADKYKGDRAYKFDGSNDRINFGDILDETVWTSGKWTISEWVYPQHSTYNFLLSKYINGQQQQFITSARDVGSGLKANMIAYGHLSAQVWRGFQGDTILSLNNWYHLCFEYDSSKQADNQVRIFVNGIKQNLNIWASAGTVSNIQNGSESLLVNGLINFNPTFTNPYKFDDVRVYNRHLTSTEIKHLASYRGVLGSPYYKPPTVKSRVIRLLSDRDTTDTSKLISVKRTKHVDPSYKSGYAQSPSESAHPNLWDGLVGAWMPSLGVTGGTLRDVSGNGNHGTLLHPNISDAWSTNDRGITLDFSPTNSRVETSRNVGISGNSARTLVTWFKTSQTTTYVNICGYGNPTGLNLFDIYTYYDGTYYRVAGHFFGGGNNTADTLPARNTVDLGKWNQVCLVHDGYNALVYANGTFSNQKAIGILNTTDTPLNIGIGNYSPTNFFDGKSSNTSIYNRALSPDEIQTLYVDSLAPFRKKQQIAFNAYPATLLERIRSAAKPTTPVSVRVKHNEKPSYKTGYAKSAGESENPHLWNGLVGAWMPSLGVTGDTLRDVSGNQNHGTLTNMDPANDWVTTSKGLALDFDGSNDFVTQADPSGFFARSGSDDLTVSCWVYPKRYAQYQSIIGNRNSVNSFNWIIYQHQNGGSIQLHGSSQYKSGYVPALNKWTHICATVNSNTCRLFANGNLVQGPFYYTYWNANPTQLTFGAYGTPASYGEPFLGGLSNLSIYNRALSPQEIQELYVDSLAPFRRKKSPIGYQPNKELTGLFKV